MVMFGNILNEKLRYSQAYNESYKVKQGSTYNNVYVDIKDMIYTNNGSLFKDTEDMLRRIYVACSRAKNKLILLYK